MSDAPPLAERWFVEVALGLTAQTPAADFDAATATRFHIDIYREEWGVFACHGGMSSWIRVTDIAFVHGRDDFQLLPLLPQLRDVAVLLRRFEQRLALRFQRQSAAIRSNLPMIEPSIQRWLETL